jgi:2-C-methyl-D-erythritol 4-phosphate cytidylyltransferase/2-C-methyl-D-erythritol 2,4-cyclodiphosphate synthase
MARLLLIVAAGSGSRLGRSMPKALVPLAGRTLLDWALDALAPATFARTVVAVPAERVPEFAGLVGPRATVVAGGETRSESVRRGVAALSPADADLVCVHDAARPLVTASEAEAVVVSAERTGAAIAATPVVDTIKKVSEQRVLATVDRTDLFAAATPQAFRYETLRRALELGDATDEAALCERIGVPVAIVPVSRLAFKVTTPEDLDLAEAILRARREKGEAGMGRVGIGFDAHPLTEGRELRLGGVVVSHTKGLEGHSDGDVLLHALTDAVLGAAGLGSIGDHFPPSDPAWRGADSARFVERARELAAVKGLVVGNVDAVVIAEAPRIAPHAARIRERVAGLLRIDAGAVSIRGTSTNGLGFLGREEGIAANVIVLLVSNPE